MFVDTEGDGVTDDISGRLDTHEAVCTYRYEQLDNRLARVEKIMLGIAATIIIGMAGAIWQLIKLAP